MALKRRLTDEFGDNFRAIKRVSVPGIKESDDNQEDSASSVGSNHPIHELIIISDDDGDEVESPASVHDVTGDEWREREGGIQSPASGETELTKKKGNEEEGDWWVKYGSMIVDDNGFLLGEFSRLDEDLYMNIMIH